jgi:hypothetical protein
MSRHQPVLIHSYLKTMLLARRHRLDPTTPHRCRSRSDMCVPQRHFETRSRRNNPYSLKASPVSMGPRIEHEKEECGQVEDGFRVAWGGIHTVRHDVSLLELSSDRLLTIVRQIRNGHPFCPF